jgi:hypothetical protein
MTFVTLVTFFLIPIGDSDTCIVRERREYDTPAIFNH